MHNLFNVKLATIASWRRTRGENNPKHRLQLLAGNRSSFPLIIDQDDAKVVISLQISSVTEGQNRFF